MNRDYDPTLGRYIEADPIGLLGGINAYVYVGQNPAEEIDPLGLCSDASLDDGSNGLDSALNALRSVLDAIGSGTDFIGSQMTNPIDFALIVPSIMGLGELGAVEMAGLRPFLADESSGGIDFAIEVIQTPEKLELEELEAVENGTPEDLQDTLDRIERGENLSYRNDGSDFQNREGLLPEQPPGYYKEYVHPTPGVDGPGAQRVIIGDGGEIYYSPDHYKTFIPLM